MPSFEIEDTRTGRKATLEGDTPPTEQDIDAIFAQAPNPEPTGGRIAAGNIDLGNRPKVKNSDGSISTVRSISAEIDGREVLLPTVSDDGRNLSVDQAIAQYKKTGKHLGVFANADSANKYAQWLHEQQAATLNAPAPSLLSRAASIGKDMLMHGGPAAQVGNMIFDKVQPSWQAGVEKLRAEAPGAVADKVGQITRSPTLGAAAGTAVGVGADMIPASKGEIIGTALAGPIAEGTVAVGKAAAPKIIEKLTGIAGPIVQRMIDRTGKIAATDITPEFAEKAVERMGAAIKDSRRIMGQKLAAIEDKVVARMPQRIINTNQIGQGLEAKLARSGFDVPGHVGEVKRKLNPAVREIIDDFTNMSAPRPGTPAQVGQQFIPGQALADGGGVMTNPVISIKPAGPGAPGQVQQMTLKDAITLKRKIYDMLDYDKSKMLGLDTSEHAMLKNAAQALNREIGTADPILKRATSIFSSAAAVYDNLAKNVLNGKTETVYNRLAKLLKKGSAESKAADGVDRLSMRAYGELEKVFDQVTAAHFSPWINPAGERALRHTGGGIMGVIGGSAGLHALGAAKTAGITAGVTAATSPALNMKAVQLAQLLGKQITPRVLPKAIVPTVAAMTALAQARKNRTP